MRAPRRALLILAVAAAGCAPVVRGAGGRIEIRLEPDPPAPGKWVFRVLGLDPEVLEALSHLAPEPERCAPLFAVYAAPAREGPAMPLPALVGAYRVHGGALEFAPRFALEPGIHHRAVYDRRAIADVLFKPFEMEAASAPVEEVFLLPKAAIARTTRVEAVYPSADLLPENLLKFYIHFSAPMARGGSYDHIRLLDVRGVEVELPFLALDEELWDPEARRFTLFFDPGRLKRGVLPLEEVGPSLERGKVYSLVVDQDWPDARGASLREAFRKDFRVGPPDRQPPAPSDWKIIPPRAATGVPLVLEFPEPLDHALLERLVRVQDGGGRSLAGRIEVEGEERPCSFTPAKHWQAGVHAVTVGTLLEDLAGNSVGRPFEVDVFESAGDFHEQETVRLPFEVRAE